MNTAIKWLARWTVLGSSALAILISAQGIAGKPAPTVSSGSLINSNPLRSEVTQARLQAHLNALQSISDSNGSTREVGTAGGDATLTYIKQKLQNAGYSVTEQPFTYAFYKTRSVPIFDRTAPTTHSFVYLTDFADSTFSAPGAVTATACAVGVNVAGSGNGNASGCDPSDFAGFVHGDIAVLQRGSCGFRTKVINAANAGASGVILFNQGNTVEREGLINPTLAGPQDDCTITGQNGICTVAPGSFPVPVLGTTYAVGKEIADAGCGAGAHTLHIVVDATSENRTSKNLWADSASGDPNQKVVLQGQALADGAGPSINAIGTGMAAVLTIAEQMPKVQAPKKMIRYLFIGADGGSGTLAYRNLLGATEFNKHAAFIGGTSLGSLNFVRRVTDGDNSTGEQTTAPPNGSGLLEWLAYEHFNNNIKVASETSADNLASLQTYYVPSNLPDDYVGKPVLGLDTGSYSRIVTQLKTTGEAAAFGGTANAPYDAISSDPLDPNYNPLGDNLSNVNLTVLYQMAGAEAHIVFSVTRNTNAILNDPSLKPGKSNYNIPTTGSCGESTGCVQ